MTKEEWLTRCAARFLERASWLTPEEAQEQAQLCFDAQSGEFEFSELVDYSPEACADEELSEWVDDKGE